MNIQLILATAAAALRGVTIQRARAAFPTRTFPRLPAPLNTTTAAAAVGSIHGYTP